MFMAFLMWMLGKIGVAPSPEDMLRMQSDFYARGHHLTLDFAGTRFEGTRWTDDDFEKLLTVGLGYEYLVDRPYNGVGLEILGQSLGPVLRPDRDRHEFFAGGGLAWYPVRNVRLFMQSGAQIKDTGHAEVLGRVGTGYRIMFFNVGVQPHFYAQTTTAGGVSWAIGCRFEY